MSALESKPPTEVKTEPKKVPRVMLTTKQKAILDKIVSPADIKTVSSELGVSRAAIYNSNKRVYQNFRGLLDAMIEYYPVFERRFTHDEEAYKKARKIARLIKGEVKWTKGENDLDRS